MATAARDLPDWDSGPVVYPWSKKLGLFALLVGPVVVAGVVFSVLGGAWDLAAIALALIWIAVMLFVQWSGNQRGALSGRGIKPMDDPRFENMVRGLANDHGLGVPELFVLEEGGPNALVLRRP